MAGRLAFSALAAGLVAANPFALRQTTEPCALVAGLVNQTQSARIDSNLALACLRSVPLDKADNINLLSAFRALAELQSSLVYLQRPPSGTLYPPVDVLSRIDEVARRLAQDNYGNEYDFHVDLNAIAVASHDYHFNYNVDILQVFSWERTQALVSVSNDSTSLTRIYLYDDALLLNQPGSSVSPVTTINGVDAESWINDYAIRQPYDHDPDASYNKVLWVDPYWAGAGKSIFELSSTPQTNDTVVTFENGTVISIDTFATTDRTFQGVTDGPSFFAEYCAKPLTGMFTAPDSPSNETSGRNFIRAAAAAPAATTYADFTSIPPQTGIQVPSYLPTPYVITRDRSLAGFLPDDEPDLAVFQVPTFLPADGLTIEYQNAVRGLLATARAQGRTRLIIDLRYNGGGDPYLDFDFFRNIFPHILPYSANNQRSTRLVQGMTSSLWDYFRNTPAGSQTSNITIARGTVFDIDVKLDMDNRQFPTIQSFFGPFEAYGDNFSALVRYDLTKLNPAGTQVLGFGSNNKPIPQVFQAQNVVLLSDGSCGSACADAAEFFKSQANVRSVVVGGRRQNGPMQGVGGTKGGEVLDAATISIILDAAIAAANPSLKASLQSLAPDLLGAGMDRLIFRSDNGKAVRVNLQNNIRLNDTTVTPLQFIYDAADCRFFYTPEMLRQQSLVWRKVYDIVWRNGACVPGSANRAAIPISPLFSSSSSIESQSSTSLTSGISTSSTQDLSLSSEPTTSASTSSATDVTTTPTSLATDGTTAAPTSSTTGVATAPTSLATNGTTVASTASATDVPVTTGTDTASSVSFGSNTEVTSAISSGSSTVIITSPLASQSTEFANSVSVSSNTAVVSVVSTRSPGSEAASTSLTINPTMSVSRMNSTLVKGTTSPDARDSSSSRAITMDTAKSVKYPVTVTEDCSCSDASATKMEGPVTVTEDCSSEASATGMKTAPAMKPNNRPDPPDTGANPGPAPKYDGTPDAPESGVDSGSAPKNEGKPDAAAMGADDTPMMKHDGKPDSPATGAITTPTTKDDDSLDSSAPGLGAGPAAKNDSGPDNSGTGKDAGPAAKNDNSPDNPNTGKAAGPAANDSDSDGSGTGDGTAPAPKNDSNPGGSATGEGAAPDATINNTPDASGTSKSSPAKTIIKSSDASRELSQMRAWYSSIIAALAIALFLM